MTGVVGSSQAPPVAQRQQHTHLTSAGWKRLRWIQILYLISVLGGRPLCYPFPSPRNLLLHGRHLNCQRATYTPALPRLTHAIVHGGPVCMLLPSIRISLVVVFVQYHRCSLSHDIVAMCCWRSISWYRLINIIPNYVLYFSTVVLSSKFAVGQLLQNLVHFSSQKLMSFLLD